MRLTMICVFICCTFIRTEKKICRGKDIIEFLSFYESGRRIDEPIMICNEKFIDNWVIDM